MSKRLPILQPMRAEDFNADGTPALWRSTDERNQMPEVLKAAEREFEPGASELKDGVTRRDFIKYLSATAAFVGLEGCTREPREPIMPYTKRPEDVVPGNALHFATAMQLDGYGTGLLATSHEGRPTKLEGNPDHPVTQGSSTVFAQAAVLGLYDKSRARTITLNGLPRGWRTFIQELDAKVEQQAKADGGARVRFLMDPSSSPLQGDLRRRILEKLPKAKFYAWSAAGSEASREGMQLAFGQKLEAQHDFSRADVVVALDSDFLEHGPEQVRNMRDFAARRDPGTGKMNRMYAVEANLSVTGGFADNRLRMKSAEVQRFTFALLAEVARAVPEASSLASALASVQVQPAHQKWLAAVAKDLLQSRGRSLVVTGERQPAAVHAAVNALNAALNNIGATVSFTQPVLLDPDAGTAQLKALIEEMNNGQVDTLLVTAINPAYSAPADLGFAAALQKVPNSIYLSLYEDETTAKANWFVPSAHFLEAWGDTRAVDGTVSIIQPLLQPLFGGASEVDVLAAFLGEADKGGYTVLREFWSGRTNRPDFDFFWDQTLSRGTIEGTAAPAAHVSPDWSAIGRALSAAPQPKTDGLEVGFVTDYKVFDGRFGNLAWLQELPHPTTKITWDNAALLSPTTATALKLKSGEVAELAYQGLVTRVPVFVLPGQADDVVTLALGYGRSHGEVATGVGFDAYPLRRSDALWFGAGAQLTRTRDSHLLAQTQEHWSMEGRQPAMMAPVSELSKLKHSVSEMRGANQPTLQTPVKYDGHKWGMAVDLTKCTGCSACVIACQSENNIPVVGKEGVARTREMHWLRIDRYFAGSLEDPQVVTQPVACVHCEAAPCEYVCPVNATVHSDEGLNEMVYNRCVGTRYCSNNCPYKVRRFNYFSYTSDRAPTEKMLMNPEVTVRSRGVMEKCTYCVQRIEGVRIHARIGGRDGTIPDGAIKTACQQACPAQAITFGDLNDKSSKVAALSESDRRYDLLYFLGTRPRTAYLARVKNPNPELA